MVQKNTSIALILTIFLIIGLGGYTSYRYFQKGISLGMDLKGGLRVEMQAQETKDNKVTPENIQRSVAIMKDRVDRLGVKETNVYSQGKDRIIIEMSDVNDPDEAINVIGTTAQLEFKDEQGKVLLTGQHLVKATAGANTDGSGKFVVNFEFDSTGADLFAKATEANVGKRLCIYLDNKMVSDPTVKTAIPDGKGYIEGNFDAKEAQALAVKLQSGALPLTLEPLQTETVGPTLGKDSLDKSVKAGLMGIVAILIFMLGYYRLPGLVADVSLIVYSILVMGTMMAVGSVLTVPGIAGFILSIGMAVDANVIIYERIKEELRNGKTIHAGIDSGFRRAFWTIFDSNITTLITALILMYFGSGAVKGFAVTLTIGLVASLLVALTLTRYLLVLFANVTDNHKLYGV